MNKKHFMSIFILGIMGLSVFGIAIQHTLYSGGGSEASEIRNVEFNSYNGGWLAHHDGNRLFLVTQPNILSPIQTPDLSFDDLNSGSIYFSTNPNNQIPENAIFTIQNNLFPYLNQVSVSCIEDSPSCATLPLRTCADATPTQTVIQVEISETSNISFENNCLLIQGTHGSITSQIEATILKLHRI